MPENPKNVYEKGELNGHQVAFTARSIHGARFAGEIQVHAWSHKQPVKIVVPGEWQSDAEACAAARTYAAVMANTGALDTAVRVREISEGAAA